MQTLDAVGWKWRTDGVEVCAQVSGKRYEIFVPLSQVWHQFAQSFAQHGIPFPASVGAPMSVGALFQHIDSAGRCSSPAVGWFGSSVVHAISHAASSVTQAALKPVASVVNTATHALSSVPVLGHALAAATTALTSPVNAVNALVQGGKVSSVAMNALKQNIASMRTLAPYAQTVISVVPGVGQGLSGAIGAGLALASGMSINDAVMAGVRDSLPGGPLAKAAFDVAAAAAQGKPVSQIALAALPISPTAKSALVQGVQLAQDLGHGKPVNEIMLALATANLPPEAVKAVQIATALSHAKSLQQAIGGVAQAAGVAGAIANGNAAAQQLLALPRTLSAPPHLTAAIQQGLAAKAVAQQVAASAAQGNTKASQFLSFLARPHISGPLAEQKNFQARFHTGPAHPHHSAGLKRARGGIHANHGRARVGAPASPVMKTFTARFHTEPTVSGIHCRFGGKTVGGLFPRRPFSYPTRNVPMLFAPRMPYQTAQVLHYAYGR